MPAGVRERGGGAVLAAKEDDLLAADRARKQFTPHLDIVGGGVPGVQGKRRICGH